MSLVNTMIFVTILLLPGGLSKHWVSWDDRVSLVETILWRSSEARLILTSSCFLWWPSELGRCCLYFVNLRSSVNTDFFMFSLMTKWAQWKLPLPHFLQWSSELGENFLRYVFFDDRMSLVEAIFFLVNLESSVSTDFLPQPFDAWVSLVDTDFSLLTLGAWLTL